MVWDVVSGVHSLPHLLVCLKGELRSVILDYDKRFTQRPEWMCSVLLEPTVCFCSEAEFQR